LPIAFTVPRLLKWIVGVLVALPLIAIALVLIFGWNWARGPIERKVTEKTGRQLVIGGDLTVRLAWPRPLIHAERVTFANPEWAKEKQMVSVEQAEFSIDLLDLLHRQLTFPEVRLTQPVVFLEQASDGRKSWLLDREQSDEKARIPIGRLTLDRGRLGYDDVRQKTSVLADISTQDAQGTTEATGIIFSTQGHYKGLGLAGKGTGGSVLKLNDETLPYPLKVEGTVGGTSIKADGTITSILKFVAMDMQMAVRGQSLAQLFPLFGIPFPETHAYATAGHIIHSGNTWRYEKFSGSVGKSDLSGSLSVEQGGSRPFLRAELTSRLLDFEDLGPLIGSKPPAAGQPVQKAAVKSAATAGHVLPEIPFKTERWTAVDADVTLKAQTIRRDTALPIENLNTHLKMKNAHLTLDPLDFGIAGGHLRGLVSLDGSKDPIKARARIAARKLQLAKLFPTLDLKKASIGEVNGEFDLEGTGNSVARMLGTANGRAGVLVVNGQISEMLMQQVGLHLVEILHLKLSGDRRINLHCGVADFGVKSGVMQANALIVDTDVTTVLGRGSVDLGKETLDLALAPRTKRFSPIALRGPIYVRGTFAKPKVELDVARIAMRSGGALALGLVNPLLALLPLIEPGPGVDPQCRQVIDEVRKIVPHAPRGALAGQTNPGAPTVPPTAPASASPRASAAPEASSAASTASTPSATARIP
jgi:AsmA protein